MNQDLRNIAVAALSDGTEIARNIAELYAQTRRLSAQPQTDATMAQAAAIIAKIAALGVQLAECFATLMMCGMMDSRGAIDVPSKSADGEAN